MSEPRSIRRFMQCAKCAREKPGKVSAEQYARLSVGLTDKGIQIWCVRHDLNVGHFTPDELMSFLAHEPDCDCCKAVRERLS